jgi:hypothetical protein
MIPRVATPYISRINRSCNALTRGSSTGRSGPKTLGRGNGFSRGISSANGGCVIDSLPSPKGSRNGATILAFWSAVEEAIANGAIAAISSKFGTAPSLALPAFVSSRLVSSADRRVLCESCLGEGTSTKILDSSSAGSSNSHARSWKLPRPPTSLQKLFRIAVSA